MCGDTFEQASRLRYNCRTARFQRAPGRQDGGDTAVSQAAGLLIEGALFELN
jgi:hypothetical protein